MDKLEDEGMCPGDFHMLPPHFSRVDVTPSGKLSLTPGPDWVSSPGHAPRLDLSSRLWQLAHRIPSWASLGASHNRTAWSLLASTFPVPTTGLLIQQALDKHALT